MKAAKLIQQAKKAAAKEIAALMKKRKAIQQQAEKAMAKLDALIEPLNNLFHTATGEKYIPKATKKGKAYKEYKPKQRRSSEDVQKEAVAAAKFIASRQSTTAKELRAKFPGLGPVIAGHIKKYGGGAVRTEGTTASMKYLPPK